MSENIAVNEAEKHLNEELDAGKVQHQLDYGQYVHLKVQNARERSRAWKTIHKIYEATTLEQIKDWYYCTECDETNKLLKKDIGNGTGPLIAHQKKHVDERTERNRLQAAATEALSNPITIGNAGNSSSIAASPENQSENVAANDNADCGCSSKEIPQSAKMIDNETQTEPCGKYHIIAEDDLPVALAKLSGVIHKHGPLTEGDFRALLPVCGKW